MDDDGTVGLKIVEGDTERTVHCREPTLDLDGPPLTVGQFQDVKPAKQEFNA